MYKINKNQRIFTADGRGYATNLQKINNNDAKEFCLNFSIMIIDPIYLAYLS